MEWEFGIGRCKLYWMDKQQDPPVWHQELESVLYDKP